MALLMVHIGQMHMVQHTKSFDAKTLVEREIFYGITTVSYQIDLFGAISNEQMEFMAS